MDNPVQMIFCAGNSGRQGLSAPRLHQLAKRSLDWHKALSVASLWQQHTVVNCLRIRALHNLCRDLSTARPSAKMVSLSKPSTAMRGLSSQLRFATVRASLLALAPRRGVKTPGAPRAAPQQQAAPAVPKSLREELGVPEFQDRIPTNW